MSDCQTCGKTGLQPDSIHTCTPLALRLADALDRMSLSTKWDKQAATELRRLHAQVEAKDTLLRQALEALVVLGMNYGMGEKPWGTVSAAITAIRHHLENKA